eukprot:3002298-Rhodomonas_salina.2
MIFYVVAPVPDRSRGLGIGPASDDARTRAGPFRVRSFEKLACLRVGASAVQEIWQNWRRLRRPAPAETRTLVAARNPASRKSKYSTRASSGIVLTMTHSVSNARCPV